MMQIDVTNSNKMSELTVSCLVSSLVRLNSPPPVGDDNTTLDFNEIYEKHFKILSEELGYSEDRFVEQLQSQLPREHIPEKFNAHWKYICLNFRIIEMIQDVLTKRRMLSVEQTKHLELCLKSLSISGIGCNIRPKLPYMVDIPSLKSDTTTEGVLCQYNILKYTTAKLFSLLQDITLRPLIISSCLGYILVGLYQLGTCPVMKPKSDDTKKDDTIFHMTEELYSRFMEDQQKFKKSLQELEETIFPPIFIKENILLFSSPNSPQWFKLEVTRVVNNIVLGSKTGVRDVFNVILGGFDDDTTKSWKGVETCTKIVIQLLKLRMYRPNVIEQLFAYLLTDQRNEITSSRVGERIFVECTKFLYKSDRALCEELFIPKLYANLMKFSDRNYNFDECLDIVNLVAVEVRLIQGCLGTTSLLKEKLPSIISPCILILFRLYEELKKVLKSSYIVNDLKEVIIILLDKYTDDLYLIFDALLFNIVHESIHIFREDLSFQLQSSGCVTVKKSPQTTIYSTRSAAATLDTLIAYNAALKTKLYGYYLRCVLQRDKYFSISTNTDLLSLETEFTNLHLEKMTHLYEALATMSESKDIQAHLRTDSKDLVHFVKGNLALSIKDGIHKKLDQDGQDFQSLFVIIMVLSSLKQAKSLSEQDPELNEMLSTIASETHSEELRSLAGGLISEECPGKKFVLTVYDGALLDISDPLLPVRAHGLMTLASLLEKKDPQSMQNKNYLLTIFQQNLKNEDSYMYLSAVRGLAALANVFTDTVLTVLCEEYADFSRDFDEKNTLETRMKLGEVLVKVIQGLGDMAPKYKALLLNTFLGGAKDDDNLIRASSLSNLGEICRVLGYKLGTILVEVLACIQAVIASDKAQEPRRAAVSVVCQLFRGVGSGVIAYFKDDILPVYRLLRDVYRNDKDEVVRLHAQMALEELNENMKDYVFPTLQIHHEKRIVELTRNDT